MNHLIAQNKNNNTKPQVVTPKTAPTATATATTTTARQVDIPAIQNPFGSQAGTIPGIATRVINILLALIIIAAVIMIVVSGFRMIVGGGNPDQLKKAKSGIIWAVIGLTVALMAFAIVSIVQKLV